MRSLWAVARETFVECLRTRLAAVFGVLLGVCVLGMALTLEGDGTLKGRIQTFLSYSLLASELLLGLVTVFLITGIVTGDVRHKYIFIVVSKPLARWQYVAGRWLGVVGVNAALLAVSLGAICALAYYLRGLPTQLERRQAAGLAKPDEQDFDREGIDSEVFTARVKHGTDPVDVEGQLNERMRVLEEEQGTDAMLRPAVRRVLELELQERRSIKGVSDADVEEGLRDPTKSRKALDFLRQEHRRRLVEEHSLVQPGIGTMLTFSNVRVPSGSLESLQLRYRLYPLHTPVSGILQTTWGVRNPVTGDGDWLSRSDSTEMATTLAIPPRFVSADGRLELLYWNNSNLQPQPTAVKLKPEEIKLMYRTGGFAGNVVRAGLTMLLRLAFLAGVGIAFAAFVSFPVACLVTMGVFVVSMGSGFILDATRFYGYAAPTLFDLFSHYMVQGLFLLLPTFDKLSPVDALVDGTYIPVRALVGELLAGTGLRTLLALAVGCVIFRRRELARVQV